MQIFTNNLLCNIFGIIFSLIIIVIVYFKWKFTYWKRKGLYNPEPTILFGNVKDWILQKRSIGEQFNDFYNDFKNKGLKHGGIYLTNVPCYIPVDTEIVKNILQKDFQHFMNHESYINEETDPLSGHLFNLKDQKWKNLRGKLTPAFTSGKMKMMFQTMVESTKELNIILEKESIIKSPVDIKEIVGRFTTNIIGSCAFGLECDCFNDSDNQFRKYGKRIFENTKLEAFNKLIGLLLPNSILKTFGYKNTKQDVEHFFMKLTHDTVAYREKNRIFRKDFMHLLLQLKNRGNVSDDDKIMSDSDNNIPALTLNELAAQSFIFFGAGFETSSTTMTFALFELTQNLEIQDKVRYEINEVLKKYNGNLTYESCMEMTYLEKVINETLRMYPPLTVLFRVCNKDYKVPDSYICIEKDVRVMIPAMSIHHDPDYYPDPKKFDPERFNEENKRSRPAFAFLPFGEGPRICIGSRFGLLQTKIGLITILKNYRISLNKKTIVPLKYSTSSVLLLVEEGVWLNFEKII